MSLSIPKEFMTGIPIPFGPMKGKLASPCICGYETDLDGDEAIHLIQWYDGRIMFCHEGCIISKDDDA